MKPNTKVTVCGAGSWGTALALLLARNGHNTTLWAHRENHAATLKHDRENLRYLPGITFPTNLSVSHNLADACSESSLVLVVVPSSAIPNFLAQAVKHIPSKSIVVSATKGFNPHNHERLSQTFSQSLPNNPICVLSGPTFATEVAKGLATAVTLAAESFQIAKQAASYFQSETFRVYTQDDVIAVELGGALKNIIAIIAGIADGLGLGANTRAAIITRGLAEMSRLAIALGAKPETLMGLSGIGDLVLTCTDDQSRSRRFGKLIAEGKTPAEAKAAIGQSIEGYVAVNIATNLAKKHKIETPMADALYAVLYQGLSPEAAAATLLRRDPKQEIS